MRCEVVAVGTELLLGQIVDTNSSWIGEQLALAGHRLALPDQGRRQPRTGSSSTLELALGRSDAVICCGGLGPTQDDITRDAIAEVMGVDLELDEDMEERIIAMFSRPRPAHARRTTCARPRCPVGASIIEQSRAPPRA